MDNLKILHASDAFFQTKPEEYTKHFFDYIKHHDADVVIFTGNMGFSKAPRLHVPTIYCEGDFENEPLAITKPKWLSISDHSVLVLPHTPEKNETEFINQIRGEEVDIIISPAAPIDTHFLNGERTYETLFDIAYFRSPRLWLSGHYKFLPYYQNTVPVRNKKKKFCNIFGVNTAYGYIEEITIDDRLNVKEFRLKRIFNGRGRIIF